MIVHVTIVTVTPVIEHLSFLPLQTSRNQRSILFGSESQHLLLRKLAIPGVGKPLTHGGTNSFNI